MFRMLRYACFDTAWGVFVLAASEDGVCGAILPVRSHRRAEQLARKRWSDATRDDRLMPDLQRRIVSYYAGEPTDFDVPLDLAALTPFRRSVLKRCAVVPYGQTVQYGELARRIGKPKASRAVGGAMAANPIPLIIPCHRVLPAGGKLGGFSADGGVDVKRRMLRLEGAM